MIYQQNKRTYVCYFEIFSHFFTNVKLPNLKNTQFPNNILTHTYITPEICVLILTLEVQK